MQAEIDRLSKLVEKKNSIIGEKEAKIEKLLNELLYLRRAIFGRSSERYVKEDPNQLSLDFQGLDPSTSSCVAQTITGLLSLVNRSISPIILIFRSCPRPVNGSSSNNT